MADDDFYGDDFEDLNEQAANPYDDNDDEEFDASPKPRKHKSRNNNKSSINNNGDGEIQYGDRAYGTSAEAYDDDHGADRHRGHQQNHNSNYDDDDNYEQQQQQHHHHEEEDVVDVVVESRPKSKKSSSSGSRQGGGGGGINKKKWKKSPQHTDSARSAEGLDEGDDHYSKEETIRKLRKQNDNLKQQLLELNAALDSQLEQRGIKVHASAGVIASKRAGQVSASDREVRSLMKQNEHYKRENEELKNMIYGSEVSDKVIRLENVVREKKMKIKQLEVDKKGLENQVREQSRALEKIAEGSEPKVQQISSDIRWLKEANRKLKDKTLEQQATIDRQNKQIMELKNNIDKLQQTFKDNNVSMDLVEENKKMKEAVAAKDQELETRKKQYEVECRSLESKLKRKTTEAAHVDGESKKLLQEIAALKQQLEDKDKELRQAILNARPGEKEVPNSKIPRVASLGKKEQQAPPAAEPAAKKDDASAAAKSAAKGASSTGKPKLASAKSKSKIVENKVTEQPPVESKKTEAELEFEQDFEEVDEDQSPKKSARQTSQPAESMAAEENVSLFKPSF